MAIAIVRKEDMKAEFMNGFAKTELLPGSFPGVYNYKCYLKAGCTVSPVKYADKRAVEGVASGTGYTQDCKVTHTRSWQVLYKGEICRNLMGVVKAVGEGTVEKGHPAVDQWNYGLDNADFTLTVEDERVAHRAGDWSFVPAGLDHSLTAEPGKEVAYIWFERFVKPLTDN